MVKKSYSYTYNNTKIKSNTQSDTQSNTQSDTQSDTQSYIESESDDDNQNHFDILNIDNKIIDNYNILYELGRGGDSVVLLVYDINDNNFYALKIHRSSIYNDSVNELKFISKLPKKSNNFTNLIRYFTKIENKNKYLCSVWKLYGPNVDYLLRNTNKGLPLLLVKKIMIQIIESVKILHNNYKVFHGDIKTDNILINELMEKEKYILDKYKKENFPDNYIKQRQELWLSMGKKLENINKMNKNMKQSVRIQVHNNIINNIKNKEKNIFNIKSLNTNIKVCLSDFGTFCYEHEKHNYQFGTRYYQAPEIILMGECSYPVDIWALGCTLYELLSGEILFDPIKDKYYDRDYYHLSLINDTCGDFPYDFIKETKYYKKYFTKQGKIIDYESPKQNRLVKKVNQIDIDNESKIYLYDILKESLRIEPKNRITINELYSHPFFIL
jgi:serine/threonine-protein kinase SRPK3